MSADLRRRGLANATSYGTRLRMGPCLQPKAVRSTPLRFRTFPTPSPGSDRVPVLIADPGVCISRRLLRTEPIQPRPRFNGMTRPGGAWLTDSPSTRRSSHELQSAWGRAHCHRDGYVHDGIATTLWRTVMATQETLQAQEPKSADPHGWIGTETVKTRFGNFEFKNGYPTLRRPMPCSTSSSSIGPSRSTSPRSGRRRLRRASRPGETSEQSAPTRSSSGKR